LAADEFRGMLEKVGEWCGCSAKQVFKLWDWQHTFLAKSERPQSPVWWNIDWPWYWVTRLRWSA
jgi:hypothetical protein